MGMLDPDEMTKIIDFPIDAAAQQIPQPRHDRLTQAIFNQMIASVVWHIFRYGVRIPRALTPKDALSEAIWLLDRYYRNGEAIGYEGAIFDAYEPQEVGPAWSPSVLAELIKQKERQAYTCWVYASELDPLDWGMQCSIVRAIVTRYRRLLPQSIVLCPVPRLVRSIPLLVDAIIESDRFLVAVCGPLPFADC